MKNAGVYSRVFGAVALLGLSAVIFAGCFGRRHAVSNYEYSRETQGARLPAFLAGPAAALLTNGNGYSVKLTVEQPGASNNNTTITGQLLVRGSHMLFAPKMGDNAFIWDVQERTGFILSESLQGYAPISSSIHITRLLVTSQTAGVAGEEIDGHPGHEAQVAITSDDGTTSSFSVWRASDLGNFPVRIQSLKGTEPLTLHLANLRSEDLELKLFQPPEGFTKYPNPDAMVGELFARKSKQKNSGGSSGGPVEPKTGVSYNH